MTVDGIGDYLNQHWPAIREQLLNGTYEPKPVRRVEIRKQDGGGMRKLGIPTVLDRVIQQAVMQVLQRRWDRTFSSYSYGFRPERSAHQAVVSSAAVYRRRPRQAARRAVAAGRSSTERRVEIRKQDGGGMRKLGWCGTVKTT